MGSPIAFAVSDDSYDQGTAKMIHSPSSPRFFTASIPVRMPGVPIKQNRFVIPFSSYEPGEHEKVCVERDIYMKEYPFKRKDAPQLPGNGIVPLLFLNFV
jgi:hypothetical protein